MKNLLIFLTLLIFMSASLTSPPLAKADNGTIIKTQSGRILACEKATALLKGTFENSKIYAENITIDIIDKNTEFVRTIKIEEGGYSPDIKILNFDRACEQIFYGASTGGSGGFGIFYVFDTLKDKPLFDYKTFQSNFYAKYIDNYKVSVSDDSNTFIVDISNKDESVLNKIYDANGILLKPLNADVSAVNHVSPFYNYIENKFGLIVYQKITGLFQADAIGYIQTYLYKNDDCFIPSFSVVTL